MNNPKVNPKVTPRRFSSRLIALAIPLLLASFAPGALAAESEAKMREAVDTILSMRHPVDTPEWWRRLGGDEPQKLVGVLISMYEADTGTYHRLRIVQALGWFDDQTAVDFLKRQAKASPQDDVVRDGSIRSVGISRGSKEREFIAGFLQSDDADTRFAAAQSLKEIVDREKDAESAKTLERYLAAEKTTWIKPKLNGELPIPTGRLGKVSTSDDHPAKLLEGVWRGFWLEPKGNKKPGMESEVATLSAQIRKEDSSLIADLTLVGGTLTGGKGRTYLLQELTRRGGTVKGVLKPASGEGALIPFTGEVMEAEGERQLEIKIPMLRATLVVRRDS